MSQRKLLLDAMKGTGPLLTEYDPSVENRMNELLYTACETGIIDLDSLDVETANQIIKLFYVAENPMIDINEMRM